MRYLHPFSFLALAPLLVAAAVVDRIAVVVGSSVITETEVLREVRLTEFMNGQPLDLGPAPRRAAAERMVDQQLIAAEMKQGDYPMPAAEDAEPLLRQVEARFQGPPQFRAALEKYGLAEADLRQDLLWQIAILRFTDMRFQPGLPAAPEPSANRAQEDAPAAAPSAAVDRQLDEWLKQARANTRIEFKPEAFQ